MTDGTRRLAQLIVPAACAALLALPVAAAAAPQKATARAGGPGAAPLVDRRAGVPVSGAEAPLAVRDAREQMRRRFGRQLVLGVDPDSGATRTVLRLDGALTGPAEASPASVARAWVRDNQALLGLDAAGVDELVVADQRTAGPSGLTTVRLTQRLRGVELFDGGLTVTLDRGRRVLAAAGEPVADPEVATVRPELDAAAARRALEATVGATRTLRSPALTLFPTADGLRLGWRLLEQRDSTATYAAVVDARTGAILLRQNLTTSAAPARYSPNYPGGEDHPVTGTANAIRDVDLEAAGYLPPNATRLSGPYVRTYSDVDDDDVADVSEEVAPSAADGYVFAFTAAANCPGGATLAPTSKCTWDPASPASWKVNREQNAVSAFALANRFHDHLQRPQIGFGPDGFAVGGPGGDDPVIVQTRDGAATAKAADAPAGSPFDRPDADHLNNANMTTLPEGLSPRMQMYLFAGPDYRAIEGGDDAATVWHEYTHGLSSRLITHADGTSALASAHGGALGEGWSDFYALDLLHREGLEIDDPAIAGQVDIGAYSDLTPHATRSQGADCPATNPSPAYSRNAPCPGTPGAGSGGYTLGDFGRIAGGTEVHSDGEIWLQSLWDLRRGLIDDLDSAIAGSDAVQRLVTDGMRLSPPEPSLLDARNAILAADTAAGGANRERIWTVFAARGMGYYATARDANDPAPTQDFSPPPPAGSATGTVTGRVVDQAGRLGLGGARVTTANQGPSATTDADGRYTLTLPANAPGTTTPLVLTAPGYDSGALRVAVVAGPSAAPEAELRRDWASAAGGATLADDPGGLCGPVQLIDETEGSGWSADWSPGARPSVTIDLPAAVDVKAIAIDTAGTCGDGPGAGARDFAVYAVDARGAATEMLTQRTTPLSSSGSRREVAPANALGVRRLRLELSRPNDSSSSFVDVARLSVYGTRSDGAPRGALRAVPSTAAPGDTITFDASSFTDPDSALAGYAWDFDGNGTVDRQTGPGEPTTTTTFSTPGARDARVTVRDVGGARGEAVASVRVTDPAAAGATPPTTAAPAPPPPPLVDPPGVGPGPVVRIAATGRRGASVSVRCASPCRLKAAGTVTTATARRLRRTARTVLVAARTARVDTLRLPLSAATRTAARARGVRRVRVRVRVRAVDAAGRATTVSRTVRIAL